MVKGERYTVKMRIYKGRAFTYPDKIDNKEVLGNPAVVILCKKLPETYKMMEMAIDNAAPITVFASLKEKNSYDVRFFGPDGTEINLCGHASFVLCRAITEYLGVSYLKIKLILNQNIARDNLENAVIECFIDGNIVNIDLPKLPISHIYPNTEQTSIIHHKILPLMGLEASDVVDIFKSNELHDFVIHIKDCEKIRNSSPNFKSMIPYCKKLQSRGIFLTSQSSLNNFVYETRAFGPHLDTNEDIACGSVNSIIANYWNTKLLLDTMNVLYPYRWNENIVGGKQKVSVSKNKVCVSGFVTLDL